MNVYWSELNKKMQANLKKESTFKDGICNCLDLRNEIFKGLMEYKTIFGNYSDLSSQPLPNSRGYDSKTIAYSLFHIFRIEDIVCNTMIRKGRQIFDSGDFKKRMKASIRTTGNELHGEEIQKFSAKLNMDVLFEYIQAVKESTDSLLESLEFSMLKDKFGEETKTAIIKTKSVSDDPDSVWLLDYWCSKDIRGLIQMPFSRHWIMHAEACIKIRAAVEKHRK